MPGPPPEDPAARPGGAAPGAPPGAPPGAAPGAAPGAPPAALREAWERGALRSVFQPIVDVHDRSVVAVEALTRGPRGYEEPRRLFEAARAQGEVALLDWACRAAAFRAAMGAGLDDGTSLFVNAEPEALASPCPPQFVPDWLAAWRRLRVVVEITERDLVHHPAELLRVVATMREMGWGIALDDVGAHPDSLALMPVIQPDVIKLDMSLVQGRSTALTTEIMHAVAAQADRTGAVVVAEGVETAAQLRAARSLGAHLAQGHLFGSPQPTLPLQLAGAGELSAVHAPPFEQSPLTPFERVARTRPVQVGDASLVRAAFRHLVRQAQTLTGSVVLALLGPSAELDDGRVRRLQGLARRSAFVGVIAPGLEPVPWEGIRGGAVLARERLGREVALVVVGAHFVCALVARAAHVGRTWDFAVTYDRELGLELARSLLLRVEPIPPTA